MEVLNSNILDSFNAEVNLTAFNNAYSITEQVINEAMTKIMSRNPHIKDYNIYVANEVFTGAEFFNSTLDIFVALDAIQIELNYIKQKSNSFLRYLKHFFKQFKENFTIFKKKKNKQKKLIKQTEKQVSKLQNYDVETFYMDLYVELSKLIYNQSKIALIKNHIKIIGDEEFGVPVNIYVLFNNNEGTHNLYNLSKAKKHVFDFRARFDNLDGLNLYTESKATVQIRVLNNLYWNIMKSNPNQIFIESLIFDCPEELYVESDYQTSLNIINYLKNTSIKNIKSICDTNINLFEEKLNTTKYETALKFISNIHF
ncbi:MAG: hypothetical protein E7378_02630 [Clostridiales bacterium]|nr:hypothetical protein [Clostridiales bacterium]